MKKLFLIAVFVALVAAAVVVWKLAATGNFPLSVATSQQVEGNSTVVVPATATSSQMMQILGSTVDDGGKSDLTQLDQEVSQLD